MRNYGEETEEESGRRASRKELALKLKLSSAEDNSESVTVALEDYEIML